jgi:4'-phosphopantetheinyl transferase
VEIARYGPVVVAWTERPTTDAPARRRAGDDLLRALVRELGGPVDAGIARLCPECGSHEHGAPAVQGEPIVVSVAYAGPLVVGAAARQEDAASVGIDVEPADRSIGDLAALFAPAPSPDLEGWTRIEAVLKATGRGIRIAPSTVAIGSQPGPLPGFLRTTSPPGLMVATVDSPAGFVVSLALADGSRRLPSEVRERR